MFATSIADAPGIVVDLDGVQSNMAYFDVEGTGLDAAEFNRRARERGVDLCPMGGTTIRVVTHLDVDRDAVATGAAVVASLAAESAA
jgi:threonine aldolase